MVKTTLWQDDYWLPLMQVYLKKPVGVKPVYSRDLVQLGMELHIAPQFLAEKMEQIARLDTPRLERIWQNYGENPRRLTRAVRLWREMRGFGAASEFYEGVELNEGFERDFHPLDADKRLMPVSLILVLNLYFQLIPSTMVAMTPEVAQMARLLGVPVDLVVEILRLYQHCDPYLNRKEQGKSALSEACHQIWQRFADDTPEQLSAFAEQLVAYFQS